MKVGAPVLQNLRITQSPGRWTSSKLGTLDHVIFIVPAKPSEAVWRALPGGDTLRKLANRRARGGREAIVGSRLPGKTTGVTLGRPDADLLGHSSSYPLLRFAGKLASAALDDDPATLGIVVAGLDNDLATRVVRAVVLAAGAWSFRLPDYRSGNPKPRRRLRALKIVGLPDRIDIAREQAEIEANNLARWLSTLPANDLTADAYRALCAELADENGWEMEFFDTDRLRDLGAGAFLAVAQGNAAQDAGICRLRYRPQGDVEQPDIALVGKGVIFDTGGNNLKPFKAMLDMHTDMGGSAVALATLVALSRLESPYAIDCWLAITENRIGPLAYKSRDVVTAADGTTIEVIHTDAEGRMILADTLVLASREKPRLMVDFATLTGTCVSALSERYCGAFTNRREFEATLIIAGEQCGERTWPFPMDPDFDDDLSSSVADVLQCSPDARADHILAARFLSRFVDEKVPWVHLDLAGSERSQPLGHVPAGSTGMGVRLSVSMFYEHASAFGLPVRRDADT